MMDGDQNAIHDVTVNSPFPQGDYPVETSYRVSFDRPTPGTIGCRGVILRRCTLTWVSIIGEGEIGRSLAESRRTVSDAAPELASVPAHNAEATTDVAPEPKTADQHSAPETAPVPPSLAAVPPVGRGTWLKEMRGRHESLVAQGTRLYNELWMLPLAQVASDTEKRRQERRGDLWLMAVQTFAGTYWGNEGEAIYKIRKTTELGEQAIGQQPPWRALLSQKLSEGREWLQAHPTPTDAAS
jgi:hypothetical protein